MPRGIRRAGDWRLGGHAAEALALELEAMGWRAEAVHLAQGVALVEVRERRRPMRLVATLRSPAEAAPWRTRA